MFQNNQGARGGSVCMSKAGLAEGTNAATLLIAAPNGAGVDYAIDGILYHRADADNIAMTAAAQQAADTTCLYAVQLDAAGALSIVKGVEEPTIDLTQGNAVLTYPEGDNDRCVIGYVKVATVAVTFTSGTTDLGAGGITDTFIDVAVAPVTPVKS